MNRSICGYLPSLLALMSPLVAPLSAQAISPPEYTYWSEVKYSVGAARGVTVGDLIDKTGGVYIIPIKVDDRTQVVAIASLVILNKELGNLTVKISVTDGGGQAVDPVTPGSPDQLADLVKTAFKTNKYFKDVVVKSAIGPKKTVFPVFDKAVIQFPNDDLSDLYGNFNGVAAAVFRDVLVEKAGGYPLAPSTAK